MVAFHSVKKKKMHEKLLQSDEVLGLNYVDYTGPGSQVSTSAKDFGARNFTLIYYNK